MFSELKAADFERVRSLFSGHKQYVPVQAIISGDFPGRVFVDDVRRPKAALAWAIGRWAYIESRGDDPDDDKPLIDLINRVIIPDSRRMNMNWFELYAKKAPTWIKHLDQCLQAFNGSRHYEFVYIWDSRRYLQFRSAYVLPGGLSLEMTELPILPQQILEAPFVSEQFRTRKAVGCRLMAGDKMVALCRSNGFAAGKEFMIDVITYDRDSRGKGYGTAATVGLLDYCLERGMIPLWETTEDNIASRWLAEKLGFVETEAYPVYAIEF